MSAKRKAKRGRPREADEARAYTMSVRLSPEERAAIEAAAARDQRPVSQWVRVVLMGAARR